MQHYPINADDTYITRDHSGEYFVSVTPPLYSVYSPVSNLDQQWCDDTFEWIPVIDSEFKNYHEYRRKILAGEGYKFVKAKNPLEEGDEYFSVRQNKWLRYNTKTDNRKILTRRFQSVLINEHGFDPVRADSNYISYDEGETYVHIHPPQFAIYVPKHEEDCLWNEDDSMWDRCFNTTFLDDTIYRRKIVAGAGYRFVEVGEPFRDTDEYFSVFLNRWVLFNHRPSSTTKALTRRKIWQTMDETKVQTGFDPALIEKCAKNLGALFANSMELSQQMNAPLMKKIDELIAAFDKH